MKELNKALDIAVTGPAAQEALRQFSRQMAAWGLVMPHVPPLVLDFGLGEFARVGEIEHWIANEVQAGYCGKFLFVFDGQTCPMHHHRQKVETFFIVKGKVRMQFDGRETILSAGDTLLVPVGKDHTFTGIGPCLVLEVSKPCHVDDNYFQDRRIPIGGNYARGD